MPITSQLWQLPFLWPWPYAILFPLHSCKTFCEVHYLKSTVLGWAHVISLTVLSGSSFLLHQTQDICFPLPYDFSFTIRTWCHSLQATCHISRLPVCATSHSTSQVLKEFSANTHKAMPITFFLLNSSQGTQKIKCFNIKLPRAEMFSPWFSLCLPFAHLHGCSGFVQCSAQGSSVRWPQAAEILKKIINKYKIYMKDKAREQATLSLLPHTTTRLDIKATGKNANLCCHANTRNSGKNSNQWTSTLYPSKSCIYQSFPAFLYVL